MIGIIDYGAGNLLSVKKAFEYIGVRVKIIDSSEGLKSLSKLVLPGVGAFESAMVKIKEKGMYEFICDWVKEGKPFLGICLGMQLLFEQSEESGTANGFGFFAGVVRKFKQVRCPQIGWNQVKITKRDCGLFNNIADDSFFYFLHSYFVIPNEKEIEIGMTDYGVKYASAIGKGLVYAVQFHPEKSGKLGLRLLENWLQM